MLFLHVQSIYEVPWEAMFCWRGGGGEDYVKTPLAPPPPTLNEAL